VYRNKEIGAAWSKAFVEKYGENGKSNNVAGEFAAFKSDYIAKQDQTSGTAQNIGKISLRNSSQQAIFDQVVSAIYDAKESNKGTINLAEYFTEFSLPSKQRKEAYSAMSYFKGVEALIKLRDGGPALKGYLFIRLSGGHSVIPATPDGAHDIGYDRKGRFHFYNYNYDGKTNFNAMLIKGYVNTDNDHERFDNLIWK